MLTQKMPFRFLWPAGFLFLALAPLVLYWNRRLRVLSKRRRRAIIAARTLLFLALILAIAELEWISVSDQLGVMFVLDLSASIPPAQQAQAQSFILHALRAADPSRDKSGLVVFAERASLEEKLGDLLPAETLTIRSRPHTEQTNLAAAIRLALASFPPAMQRRIVVLSDGNETIGAAMDAARSAQANQTAIDVVPLRYRHDNDFKIHKLDMPHNLTAGEPFELRVIVSSTGAGAAVVRLLHEGQPAAEPAQIVFSEGGKQVATFRVLPPRTGFLSYEAQVEAPNDANPSNNRGFGYLHVAGEPRVLLITDRLDEDRSLIAALLSAKLDVAVVGSAGAPTTLAQLQNFDSVVLSNISADRLSLAQMRLLELGAGNLGIGLVAIGGPDSFGAGGLNNTPLELALPVQMDILHRKIFLSGALVIILHTCEIPEGNYWAREICVAALNVLSSKDYIGVLNYDFAAGEAWIFPLQRAERKPYLRELIYAANPGDMPSFELTLKIAVQSLRQVDAAVKRIVIISDGDPAKPTAAVLTAAKNNHISISTVLIAPHSDADRQLMEAIAEHTGGSFYFVEHANRLPRIFIKEASVVRKPLIQEEEFIPAAGAYSDLLAGIDPSALPIARGYVATSAKPLAAVPLLAVQNDPLLAHWRYGLGKTVAFTSDSGSRWTPDWLSWNGYAKFWVQVVRWTLRTNVERNFQITAVAEGTRGKVIVDALDDEGRFRDHLDLRAVITAPPPDLITTTVRLEQTAPGRYEGEFEAAQPGTHVISVIPEGTDGGSAITCGLSVAYSAEHVASAANESLLHELANAAGGRVLELDQYSLVYLHDLPGSYTFVPLWPWLLTLALLLLPADVAMRRIMLSWSEIAESLKPLFSRCKHLMRRRKPAPQDETMTALLEAKRQARTAAARAAAPPADVSAQISTAKPQPPLDAGPQPSRPSAPSDAGAQPPSAPSAEDQSHTRALLKAKERAQRRARGIGPNEDVT